MRRPRRRRDREPARSLDRRGRAAGVVPVRGEPTGRVCRPLIAVHRSAPMARVVPQLSAALLFLAAVLAAAIDIGSARAADFGSGFRTKSVPVDGGTVAVTVGGSGPPIGLFAGYAESTRMWKPVAGDLAPGFTVIAPELPGFGQSSIPKTGLEMKTAAERLHAAINALGYTKVRVVGHDIGRVVAYACAAMYPQEVEELALMDAFLPGVGAWRAVYDNPGIWHFRFYGATPEALVKGRERIYFEHFWNDFAADKTHSIPEPDRRAYTAEYARSGRMAAGFAYFASFPKTATDFAELSKTRLAIPVLSIGGAKANGEALGEQARLVASNVKVIVLEGAGHWIIEEHPRETIDALVDFLR